MWERIKNRLITLGVIIWIGLPMSLALLAIWISWIFAMLYMICIVIVAMAWFDKVYSRFIDAEDLKVPVSHWIVVNILAFCLFVSLIYVVGWTVNYYKDKIWERKMNQMYERQHGTGDHLKNNPRGKPMDKAVENNFKR